MGLQRSCIGLASRPTVLLRPSCCRTAFHGENSFNQAIGAHRCLSLNIAGWTAIDGDGLSAGSPSRSVTAEFRFLVAADPGSSDSSDRLRANCVALHDERGLGSQGPALEQHSDEVWADPSGQLAAKSSAQVLIAEQQWDCREAASTRCSQAIAERLSIENFIRAQNSRSGGKWTGRALREAAAGDCNRA
jgi:hypothetical protein